MIAGTVTLPPRIDGAAGSPAAGSKLPVSAMSVSNRPVDDDIQAFPDWSDFGDSGFGDTNIP